MYRDGRQERLRMPHRRIGRMSCLNQTLIACGCLLQNEPGKGCRHRAHTPTYTFLYTWSPALVCRGVRSDPLIGATSTRTLSPKRWLRRGACDIWSPERRRSPLGSEWPRLRFLAIKYEPSCQFFFEPRFRYHVLLACFFLSFSSAIEDDRRPALVTGDTRFF